MSRMDRLALAVFTAFIGLAIFLGASTAAFTENRRPNILVIWGDDIGRDNINAFSRGMMGGGTPNIDRLVCDGALTPDAAR